MAYWPYIFDGVLLLSALVIIIVCTHNGFLKSILSFGKVVLALIVAWLFGGIVSNWLREGWLGNSISHSIYQMFRNMYEAGAETFDLSKAVEGIPEAIRSILSHLHVDMQAIVSFGAETEATAAELSNFSASVARPIVEFVCSVLGHICVFFVALLLISIVIWISDLITSLPIIHFCNQTLGFILGVILALIVVILLSRIGAALLAVIVSSHPESQFAEVYEKTYILRYLNNLW